MPEEKQSCLGVKSAPRSFRYKAVGYLRKMIDLLKKVGFDLNTHVTSKSIMLVIIFIHALQRRSVATMHGMRCKQAQGLSRNSMLAVVCVCACVKMERERSNLLTHSPHPSRPTGAATSCNLSLLLKPPSTLNTHARRTRSKRVYA